MSLAIRTNKEQIIIDTDPGHDDDLAILFLEKSRLFDIAATTIVAENSTIRNTTNNARYILDFIKSATPIYSWAEGPLKKDLAPHREGCWNQDKTK